MKRFYFISLFLSIIMIVSLGCEQDISDRWRSVGGIVVDSASLEPIIDASIIVELSSNIIVGPFYSDTLGNYSFGGFGQTELTISYSKEGYHTEEIEILMDTFPNTYEAEVNIKLTK